MVAVPSRGRADLQAPAPEAAATHQLYERYARQIYFFCLSRLRNPEEAEDATQSTFLNAFRGLQRGVAPDHEIAWLYKIAENVCLTRVRSSSRRRRVEAPDDLGAVAEVVPAPERDTDEIRDLPEALQKMPEQQRRALLLREWQGLSYYEIADELGVSQSAVETLLFRARRTLAAGLEEPKRGRLSRLRAGGDAGWLAALLKMFVFSGGGKVALVGAVAATSAVGVPGVRVALEDTFVPHMKTAAHHVAPAKPVAKPKVSAAPVVVHAAPVTPVVHRHSAKRAVQHPVRVRHDSVRHDIVRNDHGRHLGRPAAVAAAAPQVLHPTPRAPAQRNGMAGGHVKAGGHVNGNGHGNGNPADSSPSNAQHDQGQHVGWGHSKSQ